MDPKYIVIKKQDWENAIDRLGVGTDLAYMETLPIEGGYFVVREQDVFAPAGLYAYAANIHSAIEFQDTLGPSVMEEEVRERLMVLADELATMADKWKTDRSSKKVPD
jgi:hypothetical protein